MSNFAKARVNYFRVLSKTNDSVQVTIPKPLTALKGFAAREPVVFRWAGGGKIELFTLEEWLNATRGDSIDPDKSDYDTTGKR